MLNLKPGNESYAGFASFTFGNLSPRAGEELTQRGFKIYDRQLPGQPIGFARLGGIRLYCPTGFRIGHLNYQRVQVDAENFAFEETALLVLAATLATRVRRDRFSVTDSYHNICCVRERAAWCTNSRKLLQRDRLRELTTVGSG